MAVPVGTLKAEAGNGRVIYETETPYQYARVVERPSGVRVLELNEGQAQHSRYEPGTVLTGDYWDGFLVMPFAALDRPPRRMAILGNAAGTTARAYGAALPRAPGSTAWRSTPSCRRSGAATSTCATRGCACTTRTRGRTCARPTTRYDVIALDTYRQPYIPFYLSTVEFFELARDRLAPGGVVLVNVGHPEGQDGLEKVLTRHDGRGLPPRGARPDRGHQHDPRRERRRGLGRAAARGHRLAAARRCGPTAREAAGADRAGRSPAAACTRTTARRWSG